MAITSLKEQSEDRTLDLTLRPQSFNEYMGQSKVKENLHILLTAAKLRQEPLEHILLYGNSGLGKTTLAYVIAKEINTNIRVTSGPAIEKVGDLASILTNLADGDILFIDEIHRMNKLVEEAFYPAMEDYALDIIIGKGPSAKTLRLDIPKITIVGATTRIGLLSSPFRNRFGATYRLDFYTLENMAKIISRSARILRVEIDDAATTLIAGCSRRTPRVANRLLKRVRDYAQVKSDGKVNVGVAKAALQMMEVDHLGLEPSDKMILRVMIEKFKGGPVGIQSLAAAANEELDTIEDIHEPYLIQLGFLARTPRGRVATDLAYKHLKIENENNPQNLLL